MRFINLPDEYKKCAEILSKRVGLDKIDVDIRFETSDSMLAACNDGDAVIKCNQKHHFARLIAIFAENYKKGKNFEVTQTPSFDTLSCMLDVSFGSAITVKGINEYCEYLALMGFNQLQLYMEDMYEIKERPHFGYLRGRYSYDQLKAIDDYAFDLGIEVVPCMQTLGHLQNYLKWPEASSIKENQTVLLPDSEETYDFIEKMIVNSSAPFRSKQIHVGMDETHGLGLGKYLKNHGYTPPIDIFVRHLNRVTDICVKHGLKPMMWSDMLFCLSSKNYGKYNKDSMVSPEVVAKLHPDMKLIFWHYNEAPGCDAYMIDKYIDMGKLPMYAGGVWIWAGPVPDNVYSEIGTRAAIPVCKEKGVKELMLTVWSYRTTVYQTSLLELCRYGEYAYNDDDSAIKERFEFITGASYDAFMKMSNFHALYETEKDYDALPYSHRFNGNKYYLQDPLLGILDDSLIKEPRSAYYKNMADYYRKLVESENGGEWDYLYRFTLALFEYMTAKCEIGETLVPSYKNCDKTQLERIGKVLAPTIREKAEEIQTYHFIHKERYLKPFGHEMLDIQYGAMKERAKRLEKRVCGYLDGTYESLEELEQERLPFKPVTWGWGFRNLSDIMTP